jgi:hypothetical protein
MVCASYVSVAEQVSVVVDVMVVIVRVVTSDSE